MMRKTKKLLKNKAFIRTATLGYGGCKCDFKIARIKKTKLLEKVRSIA